MSIIRNTRKYWDSRAHHAKAARKPLYVTHIEVSAMTALVTDMKNAVVRRWQGVPVSVNDAAAIRQAAEYGGKVDHAPNPMDDPQWTPTRIATEELTCSRCGTIWHRPRTRGRKPTLCMHCKG